MSASNGGKYKNNHKGTLMSIKDRMEVGQTWRGSEKSIRIITGLGDYSFFCKNESGEEFGVPYSYAKNSNWTLTHDSDGNPVCEFCEHGGDVCHSAIMTVPEPGSMNCHCIREKGHKDDHVVCVSMPNGGVNHCFHTWPQEEGDKPSSVVKKDVLTFDQPLDRVDTTCLGSAIDHKNYIGWEDKDGNIHGCFKRDNDSAYALDCISRKMWESGDWSVVRPVKLWFEGEES